MELQRGELVHSEPANKDGLIEKAVNVLLQQMLHTIVPIFLL
jgi:hypothetical protein